MADDTMTRDERHHGHAADTSVCTGNEEPLLLLHRVERWGGVGVRAGDDGAKIKGRNKEAAATQTPY